MSREICYRMLTVVAVNLVMGMTLAAHAAVITMSDTDGGSESAILEGTHWSDGLAPHSGDDYLVPAGTHLIRTPQDGNDYTFAGDSLTIATGSNPTAAAGLGYKGAAGTTQTFNDLRLDNGGITHGAFADWTLAGNITLLSGNGYFNVSNGLTFPNKKTTVTADISGVGAMIVWNNLTTALPSFGYILQGNNSYQGGTTLQSYGVLAVEVDGGLGTGDVELQSTTNLILNSGTANNYLADSANLILADATSLVSLDFTGTDVISGLSFDGGVNWAVPGTWGAIGSGAANESSVFSGTGFLEISQLSGDFDFDSDVDGADFLVWQRGGSPNPLDPADLAAWEAGFGTTSSPGVGAATVPEPSMFVLLAIGLSSMLVTRRRDLITS